MRSVKDLAEEALAIGVPASMLLKSELGRQVLRSAAGVDGIVLQGGGALHHVYGSPRFSADLDFAQAAGLDERDLGLALERARAAVDDAWGNCVLEPARSRGRLHRQKLRVSVRAGMTLVLSIERYEVAVHLKERRRLRAEQAEVAVEAPAEILADKVVASLDRFLARGAMKLRDVFDIDFLLRLASPDPELVRKKLADYGLSRGTDALPEVAASLDALAEPDLREQLRGVLPQRALDSYDASRGLASVRDLLRGLAA